MQYMGLNEIREKYLKFFESKGHLRLPSFPLIPQNDSGLLLINSGMAPLKPYFSGQIEPPCKRVTTCQKCIRTPDIERVGKTARHGTFFEMLGNFSFGDYFKKEAITWAWEFVTEVMKLPVDRLYATIYLDDDETYDIWTKDIGLDPSHITRMGKEDNFWEIGAGPCGPCSEIYFDRGEAEGCGSPDCKVGCDCDRFVEFWNLVFTQFDSDGNGNYTKLDHSNIDTGMGLERLACIMQGVKSLFDVDTIKNITTRLSEISNKKYGESPETDVSLRVVTDHIRSTVFMVCDGVLPSNEGRGYVLRRLLRRAARHGKLLGIKSEHFLTELANVVIKESEKAYPELAEKADYINKIIELEEDRFNQTIDQGLVILNELIEGAKKTNTTVLDGEKAFKLYDTFGFPLDLTIEILQENSMTVDEDKFNLLMKEQRERARKAREKLDAEGWQENDALLGLHETLFSGYETLENNNAKILALISDDSRLPFIQKGDKINIVLDKTPFYAESGGQVGDKGKIVSDTAVIEVEDCKKVNGIYLHKGQVVSGTLKEGDIVSAIVDKDIRQAVMRNHSAAHLLQTALRKVLGSHINQAGSFVDSHRMRFDFSHFEAMKTSEIEEVEKIVNSFILSGLLVTIEEMPIEEAKKTGAIALFGEKYGDFVRVVKMGDVSVELCGGTHVDNTAKIGLFKIVSEAGIAAGVRRIEVITGANVLIYIYDNEDIINQVAHILKSNVSSLTVKAKNIIDELKTANKKISELEEKISSSKIDDIIKKAEDINGYKFIFGAVDAKPDVLRHIGDSLREKYENAVVFLYGVDDDKLNMVICCGKEALAKGADSGKLIKKAAAVCGGGGGGKPESATAGGKDINKIPEAIAAVKDELLK